MTDRQIDTDKDTLPREKLLVASHMSQHVNPCQPLSGQRCATGQAIPQRCNLNDLVLQLHKLGLTV